MFSHHEPWSILLASRSSRSELIAASRRSAPLEPSSGFAPTSRMPHDPVARAFQCAAAVSPLSRIGAVIARPNSLAGPAGGVLDKIPAPNVVEQPLFKGTAYEILIALLQFESVLAANTPIVFIPIDHIVLDEEAIVRAVAGMCRWIIREPHPVYLLGAKPQGPHDELGYIVPWLDTSPTPAAVYDFVERPSAHRARQLINQGGLWNTFIFGGTFSSLVRLFSRAMDKEIPTLRRALQARSEKIRSGKFTARHDIDELYERLPVLDFSQAILAPQVDQLRVLRLAQCGWWPLKAPRQRSINSYPNPLSHDSDL